MSSGSKCISYSKRLQTTSDIQRDLRLFLTSQTVNPSQSLQASTMRRASSAALGRTRDQTLCVKQEFSPLQATAIHHCELPVYPVNLHGVMRNKSFSLFS